MMKHQQCISGTGMWVGLGNSVFCGVYTAAMVCAEEGVNALLDFWMVLSLSVAGLAVIQASSERAHYNTDILAESSLSPI